MTRLVTRYDAEAARRFLVSDQACSAGDADPIPFLATEKERLERAYRVAAERLGVKPARISVRLDAAADGVQAVVSIEAAVAIESLLRLREAVENGARGIEAQILFDHAVAV